MVLITAAGICEINFSAHIDTSGWGVGHTQNAYEVRLAYQLAKGHKVKPFSSILPRTTAPHSHIISVKMTVIFLLLYQGHPTLF